MPVKKNDGIGKVLVAAAIALDVFVWHQVLIAKPSTQPRIYFLDVGQGDAELVLLPGGVKVLIDAGPDASVVKRIEKILGTRDRYIDLAIITHPQTDHFNGFNELLGRYAFGAFVVNGRDGAPGVEAWSVLASALRAGPVPVVTLGAGDRIRNGDAVIDILSPNQTRVRSKELNDTGLVMLLRVSSLRALFTADIGFKVENALLRGHDVRADVLKVGHHGSKYSSSAAFLRAVSPAVAVTEVGQRNRYGHPTKETLGRLASLPFTHVFRTDKNGSVEIALKDRTLEVFTER